MYKTPFGKSGHISNLSIMKDTILFSYCIMHMMLAYVQFILALHEADQLCSLTTKHSTAKLQRYPQEWTMDDLVHGSSGAKWLG